MLRKIGGLVSAFAGLFLLWWVFKIVQVLLALTDKQFDTMMMIIAAVLAVVGLGLLSLGWYWFSDPIPKSPPPGAGYPPYPPYPPQYPPPGQGQNGGQQ